MCTSIIYSFVGTIGSATIIWKVVQFYEYRTSDVVYQPCIKIPMQVTQEQNKHMHK